MCSMMMAGRVIEGICWSCLVGEEELELKLGDPHPIPLSVKLICNVLKSHRTGPRVAGHCVSRITLLSLLRSTKKASI